MWSMDVYASSDVPPVLAMFVVWFAAGSLLLGIVVGVVRGARRATLAKRAELSMGDENRPLVEGRDVVLHGIVRHLEANDIAVKVSVSQTGTETESSGSWSHAWVEIDRDIVVAPFLLELPNKEVVRVDPPRNVDVADALDQKVWIDRNNRVLSAELVPGETIWARGRLERSDIAAPGSVYRDVAWGWALGPTDGQMLLSSEPLGAGLLERARFHQRYAWIAAGILVALQLSLGWFYGRLAGTTLVTEVAKMRFYQTTDSDGDTHDHYVIGVLRDTNIDEHDIEIDDHSYDLLDRGNRVPIRWGSYTNWNLGAEATLALWHSLVLLSIPIAFWIAYVARRRSSRPWFRRKVNESGAGKLPDPP
ncbi:MAG: hypothetical protein ACKV2T_21175 [Kofleriaceae bacterium]